MGAEPWDMRERGDHRIVRELSRLARRAKTRPVMVLFLSVAGSAFVVGLLARKNQTFEAEVILRVSEGVIVADNTPLPRDKLEGYLRSIAFSDANLARVVAEHDLFPIARARGPRFALAELLDRIDLAIYSNYFAIDHGLDVPRTVRISVTYTADERGNALPVARSIAQLIINAASERRQTASDALFDLSSKKAQVLEQNEAALATALAAKTEALLAATSRGDAAAAADLRVELSRIRETRESAAIALTAARHHQAELSLRRAADSQRLGLAFAIADERPPPRPTRREILILAGVLAFAFAVPLAVVWAGAFDRRIHDEGDVLVLGLSSLGIIPNTGACRRPHRRRRS